MKRSNWTSAHSQHDGRSPLQKWRRASRPLCRWRSAAIAIAVVTGLITGGLAPLAHADENDQDPPSYSFSLVATLGDPVPGGFLINDFEVGTVTDHGDIVFGADLGTTTDPSSFFGEGVFLRRAGQTTLSELARANAGAPGGGTFDFLLLGQTSLNEEGNGAFAFSLKPFDPNAVPLGLGGGVWRYSHKSHAVTPVVLPNTTPAPESGTFGGAGFNTSLNNRGDLVFTGIVGTGSGKHAYGVFKQDKHGGITGVADPGDPAPSGGTFAQAGNAAWINQAGDIAFVARLTGEEGAPDQIEGLESLYLKKADTGTIQSIVHAGDPEPCGGHFRSTYSPVMNDSREIVFQGDLTSPSCSSPPCFFQQQAVYLHSEGETVAVACPGDPMPGGGNFLTTGTFPQIIHINNAGEVVFDAILDTNDTGLYLGSHDGLRVVARAGTVIPAIGTVDQLLFFAITFPPAASSLAGSINNDRGQILFGARLTDKRGVLLLATPRGDD